MVSLLVLTTLFNMGLAAAVGNKCAQAPYAGILPLSTYQPALAFCSALFPLPICTTSMPIALTTMATATVVRSKSFEEKGDGVRLLLVNCKDTLTCTETWVQRRGVGVVVEGGLGQ